MNIFNNEQNNNQEMKNFESFWKAIFGDKYQKEMEIIISGHNQLEAEENENSSIKNDINTITNEGDKNGK